MVDQMRKGCQNRVIEKFVFELKSRVELVENGLKVARNANFFVKLAQVCAKEVQKVLKNVKKLLKNALFWLFLSKSVKNLNFLDFIRLCACAFGRN